MTSFSRTACLLLAMTATVLALPLEATVARYVPFDQKVDEAEAIVLGRVVGTRASFDPTGRWIVTTATVEVDKSYKGAAQGGTVELVLPGGAVGGIRQETVGVPSLREGDERILFVKNERLGPTVLYLDQGSYEVVKDSSGRRTVAPASSDMVLLDSQTGKIAAAEETRSLESFEREISLASERIRRQRLTTAAVSPARAPQRTWRESALDFLDENKVVMILLGIGLAISLIPLLRRK